ncbi:MAG: phosphopantothenoylcysteine decarboxylase, partial [Candidatus Gastranaerophilales bacterium]|nr:phosphopantothenoylcysteine decarboxylase [Candidatus Gastranaerophilales bacterium]
MTLSQKTILIGITGGIAAYKICELIRMYKRSGANVKIIATPNAMNFVTELTLATLSQNEVYTDNFDIKEYKPEHISLCDEGDILVIAPATANTISKIANGICDNLLTSITCAFNKPIILAPAMNTNMWNNKFVQENLNKLKN